MSSPTTAGTTLGPEGAAAAGREPRRIWDELVMARAFDRAMSTHNPHWHEARGEEAVVVGGFAGLRDTDVVAPHFRGACAVAQLRGTDAATVAANVFGTADGSSRGHWRGDICPTPGDRMIGMFSGSLGTTVAYATGAALRLKQLPGDDVVVCAFGDGTANAGIVSESLNLASMLRLPIVFVCQNNQYATSLPAAQAIAGGSVTARATGFGLPAVDVDGNDVLALTGAREEAVARARAGEGPTLLHALTYRMGGHYMNDPEVYRSEDEVAEWGRRDPLQRHAGWLADRGELDREVALKQLAEAEAAMDEIVAAAKQGAAADQLETTAYAETWEAAR